jgi:3-dehydroquinate synthase
MTLTIRTTTASYPVIVAAHGLAQLPQWLHDLGLRGTLWLISDAAISSRYADPLAAQLRTAGFTVAQMSVPSGEASKSLEQLAALHTWMISGGVERRDAVLALGGGVVGDLAGFAAATVLRGIAVVQLPTTLLAMVDSAVGGKTGINHPLGKNLIGAFHQPRLVLADTTTLASLPPRELQAGWAEVIKHGVIRDAGLFAQLEAQANAPQDAEAFAHLIQRAVAVKVAVVNADEREQGERMILNYGHTIGHAVEALVGYGGLLHGECVAIGMHAAAQIAHTLGLCDETLITRQQALLHAYGLATAMPAALDPDAILALTLRDKKVQAKQVRWILPTAIGSVEIRNDVPERVVRAVLRTATHG